MLRLQGENWRTGRMCALHLDHQLAEIFAREKLEQRFGECLQALDDILARFEFSDRKIGGLEECALYTLIISLPKFSPVKSLSSVSGNVSRPSTISSRDLSFPCAIQPPISRAASLYRAA